MEKKIIQKFSLVGMLLVCAAAVTAAVVSSGRTPGQVNSMNNGRVLANSGAGGNIPPVIYSCVAGSLADCHLTANTFTAEFTFVITGVPGQYHFYSTIGNTSLSNPQDGIDTTSILYRVL